MKHVDSEQPTIFQRFVMKRAPLLSKIEELEAQKAEYQSQIEANAENTGA